MCYKHNNKEAIIWRQWRQQQQKIIRTKASRADVLRKNRGTTQKSLKNQPRIAVIIIAFSIWYSSSTAVIMALCARNCTYFYECWPEGGIMKSSKKDGQHQEKTKKHKRGRKREKRPTERIKEITEHECECCEQSRGRSCGVIRRFVRRVAVVF